jgi:hypothetical protein
MRPQELLLEKELAFRSVGQRKLDLIHESVRLGTRRFFIVKVNCRWHFPGGLGGYGSEPQTS